MADHGVVLVTGSAGYLGSHAMVTLIRNGLTCVGVDSFRTSSPGALDAIGSVCGERPRVVHGDLRDEDSLSVIFEQYPIDLVLHFAGAKSVVESVADPVAYYSVNVESTLSLLRVMNRYGVRRLVFSSSCTVYGNARSPIGEAAPIGPVSPYGATKATIERILQDVVQSDPGWSVVTLRYFNPIGADPSGLIGEDPTQAPTTLMPHVMSAARSGIPLKIFGSDYPTPDGTCVRDFVHVCDLIDGHLAAADLVRSGCGFVPLNLGTGAGSSVLELVEMCSQVTGIEIPYEFHRRRHGDASSVFADPSRAREVLGWEARRSLSQACLDHHRWATGFPSGYPEVIDLDSPSHRVSQEVSL